MSDPKQNWRHILIRATRQLAAAGIAAPDYDARALLAHHLKKPLNTLHIHLDQPVTDDALFEALIARRAAREPLAHITGYRGFWSLDLAVTPDVLDPRPDTETLIEAVLKTISDRRVPLRILDIGTGSGAVILALLSELPHATAIATDISDAALATAQQNAAANGLATRVTFQQTSWAQGIEEPFDIIVSNPPYIRTNIIATLDPEVQEHEPHLALDGGSDGLAAYKDILAGLPTLLPHGATIAFEIGFDQADEVQHLMEKAHITDISITRDFGGNDRVIMGRYP
ncbi:MAG: peptide chain release factor N(5)-glutamine methyltransferase [Alphaproteobacteria bacterium]